MSNQSHVTKNRMQPDLPKTALQILRRAVRATRLNDWLVGFELEYLISNKTTKNHRKRCKALPKSHIGYDCTLLDSTDGVRWRKFHRPFAKPIELRIGPFTGRAIRINLRRGLTIIKKYGITTRSCGLHVHITRKNRHMDSMHMDHDMLVKLHDEDYALSLFPTRQNCNYAKSNWVSLLLHRLDLYDLSKYHMIRPISVHSHRTHPKFSRLEFRLPGGLDYEDKETEVMAYLRHVMGVMSLSMRDHPDHDTVRKMIH